VDKTGPKGVIFAGLQAIIMRLQPVFFNAKPNGRPCFHVETE